MSFEVSLTILAQTKGGIIVPPRTKKNHAQLIPNLKRPLLVPSAPYREWERAAIRTFVKAGLCRKAADGKRLLWHQPAISQPVNCRALIFRDRLTGDAVGFYQAIGDLLELAGVVENDRYIVSWDGTRLLKDKERPRVEVVLTEVGTLPLFVG